MHAGQIKAEPPSRRCRLPDGAALSKIHFTVTTRKARPADGELLHCLMRQFVAGVLPSPYGPLLRNECSPTDHR
ncbi:hypothetical protein KCP70_13120 [Salmonella enterica subsp. enterica]|nr:hypothetical protein KCP70_13120 [Salmonella enterica subsp. enterica]